MNIRNAGRNFLHRLNWPAALRLMTWYLLMQGMWMVADETLAPILGKWPTFGLGMVVAFMTLRWMTHMEEDRSTAMQGKFWWVWWDHKDVRIWRGMTDAEKAICSAYKVPPALVGTRRTQGPQNG